MTQDDFIDFPGRSGKSYRYWFLDLGLPIKAEAGNYTFVKELPTGNFVPLYFGETNDLQTRMPGHERWRDALRAGATHVFAHTTPGGEQVRCAEERDLIELWQPALNVQHRQAR